MISELRKERPKDIGKACRILSISRSSLNYQSLKQDEHIMKQLEKLAQQNPVEGFWKCYYRLRNGGYGYSYYRGVTGATIDWKLDPDGDSRVLP